MAPALPFKKRISEIAAEAFLHQVSLEHMVTFYLISQTRAVTSSLLKSENPRIQFKTR